jgi:hypothetical protein
MKRNIITLVFEKVSKWKGELYPLFDRESEQKLFEKKRARAPPEDKGDKKYRSGGGSTPARAGKTFPSTAGRATSLYEIASSRFLALGECSSPTALLPLVRFDCAHRPEPVEGKNTNGKQGN